MATLILNAGTASPISVTCQRAGKASPRFVGSKSLSFSGRERTSIRGQAKVIPIVASYVSTADEAAIQAAVMNGVQIPCSGDILGNIQTLCSIDNVVSNMVPGLVDFWEMSFTLSEVNASVVLLRYAPGDTITGESFTRSTVGAYYDVNGVLQSAAINTKRDVHFVFGIRSLFLEDTRANEMPRADDFSNAAWVKTNITPTPGVADPWGGTRATTLTATAGNATIEQQTTNGANVVRDNSTWIRRRTGVGNIQLLDSVGAVYTTKALTGTFQRLSTVGATGIGRWAGIKIVTSGDAVDVVRFQQEAGNFSSSEILTVAAAVTRGADSYSLPFAQPPVESTGYVKFNEQGTILVPGAVVAQISSAAGANPSISIHTAPGGVYRVQYVNGSAHVEPQLALFSSIGDVVELMWHLYGDGSVDITQSLNAGAPTSSAQSAAIGLPAAWSGPLAWLNSNGTIGAVGFTALQSFKIVAGARSLAEMRAA